MRHRRLDDSSADSRVLPAHAKTLKQGLAEEGETVLSKASAAKMMPQAQPEVTLNGHIGAFYPSGTEVAGTKARHFFCN